MKHTKLIKRLAVGMIGSIALTSFILFALDAYLARQAALRQAVQQDADAVDKAGSIHPDEPLAKNTVEDHPSIGASERHMLYQPQQSSIDGQSDPDTSSAGEPSDQELQADSSIPSGKKSQDGSSVPSDSEAHAEHKQANGKKQPDKQPAKNGQASDKKNRTFQTVTKDYFKDALFIGDSRTIGMQQSQLLPECCYYAKTGIGIGDILTERIVSEGGSMISVTDALSRHTFGKVYIMIGINDISCGDVDWFLGQYQDILDTVARTQPDAVVYIQSNIPMSYGTQDLSGSLNNANLALRNQASSTLADSKTVFYLDISQVYADANGNLASLYTRDGLHVKPNYYALWVDYLLHHAIVYD